MLIAGIDEAGRGALAGPVVAAAVVFRAGQDKSFYTDSKLLKPDKREELYLRIQEESLAVGIGVINHLIIDQKNILKATFMAMKKALEKLKLSPDLIIIDGNQRIPDIKGKQKTVVKGDLRVPVVSAASIVAKVIRDRIMTSYDLVFPEYGFSIHKGYGTKLHYENIEKHELCILHRKTFNKKYFSEQLKMF